MIILGIDPTTGNPLGAGGGAGGGAAGGAAGGGTAGGGGGGGGGGWAHGTGSTLTANRVLKKFKQVDRFLGKMKYLVKRYIKDISNIIARHTGRGLMRSSILADRLAQTLRDLEAARDIANTAALDIDGHRQALQGVEQRLQGAAFAERWREQDLERDLAAINDARARGHQAAQDALRALHAARDAQAAAEEAETEAEEMRECIDTDENTDDD